MTRVPVLSLAVPPTRSARPRGAVRCAAVLLVAAALALVTATAALAHIEVEADPAQAGAANATLSFSAEGESTTAGIAKLEVISPEGFDAAGTQLASGPQGWTLSVTDRGFVVSGPALPPSEDLDVVVRVRKLPDAATSEFKALVTYSDGHVDRWIQLRQAGAPEPDMPAALLTLEPSPTTSAPPSTSTPSTSAPPSTSTPSTTAGSSTSTTEPSADTSESDDDSSNVGWVVAALVVAGAVAAGAVLFARSRRRPTDPT